MSDNEMTRDLECLRLASDLVQLSRDTLDPALQAHCIRMASYWSGHADRNPNRGDTRVDDLGM
jgi:hypothetical protein